MKTRSTRNQEPSLREARRIRRENRQTENQPTSQQQPVQQRQRLTVVNGEQRQDDFHKIYSNVKSIPSYSSKITAFLRQNETSSLHKPIRKNFKRRKTIAYYPYELCMADVAFYNSPSYVHANGGVTYILVFIDVFTKMCYVEPMKDKEALSSVVALENILRRLPDLPKYLATDKGTEFTNRDVQNLFAEKGIIHYILQGKHKASVAERMIRTLKGRLEKYFWQNKTKRYVDVLQQIVYNYNHTPHRSIGMAPVMVNFKNRKDVFDKLFPNYHDRLPPRLHVGDLVRIPEDKTIFEKGYTRSWSIELYTIVSAKSRGGIDFYKVQDAAGNILPRERYYYQLNLVKRNDN